ncbi:hypothetical protein [uncultured Desulfosarcina sp.]|uniref:hypothetical protein n=1 Tax=uncultured Desulfosarcina sp. TaxID=218289 RepID=UPI0029C8070B|nr:hypothetical protein [uncultured Desulfosarcina sp.]
MPKYKSLNEFLTTNKSLQCNVRGCDRKRTGKSNYCGRHRARAYTWGHPEAGAVKSHVYSDEIEAVTRLLAKNADHEAIQYGRDWLAKMMAAAAKGGNIRGSMYWANLHNQEVDPGELLSRLAGLWLFDQKDEIRRIIKNDNHLTALSGNTVIRFAKMNGIKYVPPKIYRQVGDQVRQGIGPLLINICRSSEKIELRKRNSRSKMLQALDLDGL